MPRIEISITYGELSVRLESDVDEVHTMDGTILAGRLTSEHAHKLVDQALSALGIQGDE